MVVPPWYEVPPPGYGGLELVAAGLVDALTARGHQVTVFGAGAYGGTTGRFVSTVGEPQQHRLGEALPELVHLARVNSLLATADFDVLHDHTMVGPLLRRPPLPAVATVHNNPVGEFADLLRGADPQVGLVAISAAQRRLAPDLPWIGVVHNGVDMERIPRKQEPAADGPVLWLARFSADKGPEAAIRACRDAGLPLLLVGKCREPAEHRYLTDVIRPQLGADVRVLLNVDRARCLELLLTARCLIMPLQWEEPFGMVMVEAMATGTPVVALSRGAVPEVVRHGVTGFSCAGPEELSRALGQAHRLDPQDCVRHVDDHFSTTRMAAGYEQIYHRTVRAGGSSTAPVADR
ncbi:glycosyltransferase family 4 protein [Micromonosporaceae bacterium DT55]|uniref:glycosyltransferase family 4 protein n=1 Tax=Melissospora conviva TaxID=3388432 RepID=UPI003C1D4BEB